MAALLIALALFGAAWLAHLLWWRVRLPRRQSLALIAVFAAVPVIALPAFPGVFLAHLVEIPAMLALYAGAAACYLIVYTGIEQTSPTLVIVRALARAGQGGCSKEDLAGLITEEQFVRPRLEALALDGLIAPVAGGWALTARGRQAAQAAVSLANFFRIRENA